MQRGKSSPQTKSEKNTSVRLLLYTRRKCSQSHPIHCQLVLEKSHEGRLTSLCVTTVNAYETNFFILKARNYDIYRLEVFVEDVTYTTITII